MIIGPRPEVPAAGPVAALPGAPVILPAAQQRDRAREAAVAQALEGLVQTTNLLAMAMRIQGEKTFDGRNKVFHEYFDKQQDEAGRLPYFATFMELIPKDESARVLKYLEALGDKPS